MLRERLPRRAAPLGYPAACLFVLTTAAALAAQDEVVRAIADLQNADRQPHAFAVLQAAGAACVPQLCSLLAKVGTENEPRPEQLVGALYVLGCMGKPAVPALAEVQDAYRNANNAEVLTQSMWAMTRLAIASGETEVCRKTTMILQNNLTRALDFTKMEFAYHRLRLGPEPTTAQLLQVFTAAGQPAAAAAAAAADMPRLDDGLAQALEDALDLAVARPATPWLRRTQFDTAGGEIAAALWQHGHRNTKTARGLLQHWNPRSRHAGLQALLQPLHMTVEERLDVVSALWDRDRVVREQALANLQSYGRHGLLALRALRIFEKYAGTSGSAPIYQRAASRLLRDASTGASDVATAMLQDADLILRGEKPRAEVITSDELSSTLLADIVLGCRGEQEGSLEALARLAMTRKAFADRTDDGLLLAFVSSLGTADEAAWFCAARAVAVLGPRVARRLPDFTDALLQSRTSFERIPNPDIVFVVEAEVLAGQGACVAELREALDSPRWHVVLHALVELMHRNAITPQDAPRLRALLSARFTTIGLTLGVPFVTATGAQPYSIEQPERSDTVQLVATLALAGLGETPWTDRDVCSALADAWSLESSEVPAAVADAIKEGRLAESTQKIEAKARSQMRWPRFP